MSRRITNLSIVLLAVLLMLPAVPQSVFASEGEAVAVAVDGRVLHFPTPAILIGDVTMVPMRPIFEALGARVAWDAATSTVTAVKGETTVSLSIGSSTATKNGLAATLARAPMLSGGSTLVPLRFVSEALGGRVAWSQTNRTAYIWGAEHFQTPIRTGSTDGHLAAGPTSIALKDDGTVWTWGVDEYQSATPVPSQVPGLTDVKGVSGYYGHYLAVKSDGTVWEWGWMAGVAPRMSTPVQRQGLSDVVSVSAGLDYGLAVRRDGTVWGWGGNDRGQLGDGTRQERMTPAPVTGLTGVRQVATGETHAAALKLDGTVWTWGQNNDSALGTGDDRPYLTPVQVQIAGVSKLYATARRTYAIKQDGTAWAWGMNIEPLTEDTAGPWIDQEVNTPQLMTGPNGPYANVVAIASGRSSTVLVQADGTAWGWYTPYYSTDIPTLYRNLWAPRPLLPGMKVTGASVGLTAALLQTENGELWGWGTNVTGTVGDGNILAPSDYSLSLFRPGVESKSPVVTATRPLDQAQGVTPTSIPVITFDGLVEPGSKFSAIALSDSRGEAVPFHGSVVGKELLIVPDGALGVETAYMVTIPAGALTSTDGVDSAAPFTLTFTTGLADHSLPLISGGNGHSLVVAGGQVYEWGDKRRSRDQENGQVGNSFRPVRIEGLPEVVQAVAGAENSFAVGSDGSVWGWGEFYEPRPNGPRWYGVRPVRGLPPAAAIALGDFHYLVLTREGKVWAWGSNDSGQLGTKSVRSADEPIEVPGLNAVKAVAAARGTSVALRADGTVWVWGENASPTPAPVPGLAGVVQIAGATEYGQLVALRADGTVWRFEATGAVQIKELNNVASIAQGSRNHGAVLRTDGTVWTYDYSPFDERYTAKQLSVLGDIRSVGAGSNNYFAVRGDGTVWAWGENNGELGDWSMTTRATPVRVILP